MALNVHQRNIKWLTLFSPFTLLPFSGAFVTPFLLSEHLGVYQIFLLQSIYAVFYLLWTVPGGHIADKYGNARSIKLGALIAAFAMIFYGLSSSFWLFALCEIALALGSGLIEGADRSLLISSLNHEKRSDEYVKLSQRMSALGWMGAAIGVPISILLVSHIGLGATLTADGILLAIGCLISFKLRDTQHEDSMIEAEEVSSWKSVRLILDDRYLRWLTVLTVCFSTGTYLAFWIVPLYYQELGITVAFFSIIFAIRSAWKAWLSHVFHKDKSLYSMSTKFTILNALVFICMATQQLWLLWVVLGHDVIDALHAQPINKAMNERFPSKHRATLNSAMDFSKQLAFAVTGPFIGIIIDKAGLASGLLFAGFCTSGLALFAISRLKKLYPEN